MISGTGTEPVYAVPLRTGLTDYFLESDAPEEEYFRNLRELKRAQGLPDNTFYHYDTPLTVGHETETLQKAGFRKVQITGSRGSTCTFVAEV